MSNRYQIGPSIGFVPASGASSNVTSSPSAANSWTALGFAAPYSGTISEVSVFCLGKSGSPIAADITADIYSASAGKPASAGSLGSVANTTAPASNVWLRFPSLSVAVTGGLQYYAVFKNVNATPATNNVTFQYSGANALPADWGLPANAGYGWARWTTTTGDGGWGGQQNAVAGLRVKYSDGTYFGLPVQSITSSASAARIYGTAEMGSKLTLAAGPTFNVTGISLLMGITGTPAGDLELKLYVGTTLVGTTPAIPRGHFFSSSLYLYATGSLPSVVAIPGGSTVRVVGHQVGDAGDSSNAFTCLGEYTIDSDANSLALLPNAIQRTRWDGSAWDDTATTQVVPASLRLDPTGPYTASSGGRRGGGFNGGFNG